MYPDSEEAEKDEVAMSLDWKLVANGDNLLSGKIDDAMGIHSKLRR